MNHEILDNRQLAERWKLAGTSDAIAKRFQRLRALPVESASSKGVQDRQSTRYRMTDILEYEDRNARKFRKAFV